MKKILCLTVLLLVATVAMFADIARPGKKTYPPIPKPGSNTVSGLTIHFDSNINEPTIRIPRSTLKYLRAQNESGEGDQDNIAAVTAPNNFSRTQALVSGMFLSLALVFGGMWFVRSGKAASKEGKALVILAIMAGIGSAATFVYADIAPLPAVRITSKVFDQNEIGYGQLSSPFVRVESSNGTDIELYVPVEKEKPTANVNK